MKLSQGVGASCFPDGPAEIELFASDTDRALLATVYASSSPPADFGDKLRSAIPNVESVCWRDMASRRATTWGSGAISYHVGEFHYRLSHESFFQANRFLLSDMIQAVVGDLEGSRALDLYAGVGFFTLPLSRRFEKVAAVEAEKASAQDLAANAGVVGLRARAYHKSVEKFLEATSRNWDAVIVNPPRSGLSRVVLERLARLRCPQVVYISCDPTTLARDLTALLRSGYRMRSVHLVDQFPQTFHIESVVHLKQAE